MNPADLAFLGSQTVLGLIGLGVGGAKVTHQDAQIEEFQRFGYPQWVRIGTGVVEIVAGIGLIAGVLWRPALARLGALLFAGVMIGAVITHHRAGDPPATTAIPAVLCVVTAGLLAIHYFVPI